MLDHITRSWKQIPITLIAIMLFLSAIGFVALYSSAGGEVGRWAKPQMIRFGAGCILLLFICLIKLRFWMSGAYLFYGLTIILLIYVEVSGHIGMGAQRWIDLGVIKLQPSELAKISVILALARYFHHFPPYIYSSPLYLIMPTLIILLPVGLILKQPNLGTATLLTAIAVWIGFAGGLHRRYFIIGTVLAAITIPIGWHYLHDYQKQRVMTFLEPSTDPLGSGYNITQSIIAIGSGGMSGKGLLNGSQTQLDFLPEKQTDFIFTVLAEEFGFMGGVVLLCCYSLLILYIIGIAYRSVSLFGTLVAHGVAAMLTLHMFINIGMVMGILPVVGIPLPLLSYGGSIMISTMIALGLVCNAWIYRDEKLKTSRL